MSRQEKRERRLVLICELPPGDILLLTAAVRDLHRYYPGRFKTDVRTPYPDLWFHNPFISRLNETEQRVETIQCHYPLIHRSNQSPYHFIHGFIEFLNERLQLRIRATDFKGDIYLSDAEKNTACPLTLALSPDGGEGNPYWLIVAGGKTDFTIKWWETVRWQRVVDYFRGRIQFVQVGAEEHHHPALDGVIDLRGKTTLRDLIRLVYHAQGVVCPVTLAMHLAAAVPIKRGRGQRSEAGGRRSEAGLSFASRSATPPFRLGLPTSDICPPTSGLRPCVVVAGGREPPHWEAYPGHQFIHTIGQLSCCRYGGCWKARTVPLGDGDPNDQSLCENVVNGLPRCIDMITPGEVIRRIESYFTGGMCEYRSSRGNEALISSANVPPNLTASPLAQAPSAIFPLPKGESQGEGEQRSVEPGGLALPAAPDAPRLVFNASTLHPFNISTLRPFNASPPLTPETVRLRMQEFIESAPLYPESYQGCGIVICGGGQCYFTCAWVCINMLRRLGCSLPIQLWHLGPIELDQTMAALVAPLGVQCVDALELCKVHPARRLSGWELKPYSILHSPFAEVLLLDADNMPVVNPEFLFKTPQYLQTGAVFWPDRGQLGASHRAWTVCGIEGRNEPDFESGQLLVAKKRCWREMQLTLWMNEHSDFFYRYVHGDKDTFHLAWRKLKRPYSMPPHPLQLLPGTFCQHDFQGHRLFQHRTQDKWTLFGANQRVPGFLFEAECFGYLEDLRRQWCGIPISPPMIPSRDRRDCLPPHPGPLPQGEGVLHSVHGRLGSAPSAEDWVPHTLSLGRGQGEGDRDIRNAEGVLHPTDQAGGAVQQNRSTKLAVVTVASQARGHFAQFQKSWERVGVQPIVLGWNRPFGGLTCKIRWLDEFLREHHGEFTHLLFCDAFDTVTATGPDEILNRFHSFHAPIVFSAERNCWPDPERGAEYPPAPTPYKHLNSGLIMGTTESFRAMFKVLDAANLPENQSDQRIYTNIFLRRVMPLAIDYHCLLFQSLHLSEGDVVWDDRAGRIRNRITGNDPCLFHGNGTSNMSGVLQWLAL